MREHTEVAVDREHGALRPFPRDRLAVAPVRAAEALLGAVLVRRFTDGAEVWARIVEVEAYAPDDPASHSYRGPTPRCQTMFGPPGVAYVYRSYGIHRCLNVSVGAEGEGAAVLVRAAAVLRGTAEVRRRRPHVRDDAALLRGPGNLTEGLDIGLTLDGHDLLADGALSLVVDGFAGEVERGPRVGVSQAADRPWRLVVSGAAAVSRYRRSPRAS